MKGGDVYKKKEELLECLVILVVLVVILRDVPSKTKTKKPSLI